MNGSFWNVRSILLGAALGLALLASAGSTAQTPDGGNYHLSCWSSGEYHGAYVLNRQTGEVWHYRSATRAQKHTPGVEYFPAPAKQ